MKGSKKHIRADIQALRALAVLAVVVYHLWPGRLTGGFMGVDIFFVISGYLMTLTLLRDIDPVVSTKRRFRATIQFLGNFYARRIKRLIPAASVTLLGILGLITLTGNLSIIESTAKQVSTSALFVQNLFLASESVDYLASANPPTAAQHFWSLSLEEQFYLVWPLLLLIIVLVTMHINIVYKHTKISGAILPVGILITLFFLYGYQMTQEDSAAAYFITFARVWELLFGALIAFLPKLRNHDVKLLLPWLGFGMILYALYKWDGSNFPGWHALVPVLGTALIIWGGSDKSSSSLSFANMFKARIIQWIGNISYSLYLWHWPLIILLPVIFMVDIDGPRGLLIKLGIALLSFIMAWLSYRFVEKPTQALKLKKRWIYAAFIVLVGGIGAGGFLLSNYAKAESETRLQELHRLALSGEDACFGGRAIKNKDCPNPFGKVNERFSQTAQADIPYASLHSGEIYEMYDPKNAKQYPHRLKDLIYLGDTSSDYKVVIWGDSHARHWLNALEKIGKERNITFIAILSGQCATLLVTSPQCDERLQFIRDSKVLTDSDAIVVSLWHLYGADHPLQPTYNSIAFVQKETDKPVYLLEDIPLAGNQGGPLCLAQGKSCKTSVSSALTEIKKISEKLVSSDQLSRDHIIPTDDMFCRNETCYSFIGGLPVYHDKSAVGNSHITVTYSLTLAGMLESKLASHGVIPKKD